MTREADDEAASRTPVPFLPPHILLHPSLSSPATHPSLFFFSGTLIGPQADSPWLYVVPWGIHKMLKWVAQRYGNPPLFITENGISLSSFLVSLLLPLLPPLFRLFPLLLRLILICYQVWTYPMRTRYLCPWCCMILSVSPSISNVSFSLPLPLHFFSPSPSPSPPSLPPSFLYIFNIFKV